MISAIVVAFIYVTTTAQISISVTVIATVVATVIATARIFISYIYLFLLLHEYML